MLIGQKLREIREAKNLSQGDIEHRTGLIRCYVSRVENGHTVPAVETLEKFARALEVPLYHLFYDGEKPPKPSDLEPVKETGSRLSKKELREWKKLLQVLPRVSESRRQLLLHLARKMAKR